MLVSNYTIVVRINHGSLKVKIDLLGKLQIGAPLSPIPLMGDILFQRTCFALMIFEIIRLND